MSFNDRLNYVKFIFIWFFKSVSFIISFQFIKFGVTGVNGLTTLLDLSDFSGF